MFKTKKDFVVTKSFRFEVDLSNEQREIYECYIEIANRIKEIVFDYYKNKIKIVPKTMAKAIELHEYNQYFNVDMYEKIISYCLNVIRNSDKEDRKRFKNSVTKTMKMFDVKPSGSSLHTDLLGDIKIIKNKIDYFMSVQDNAIEFLDVVLVHNKHAKLFFVDLKIRTNYYESMASEMVYYEGIGIDVGSDIFLALSDGTYFKNILNTPDVLKLSKMYFELSCEIERLYYNRKNLSSAKRDKITKRIERDKVFRARAKWEIDSIIQAYIQDCVIQICAKNPAFIVIETLNMFFRDYSTMEMRDQNIKFFKKVIVRTCNELNIPLVVIPVNVSTSKVCSNCGSKNVSLHSRTFTCNECHYTGNRDFNAAKNIRREGEKILKEMEAKKKNTVC